MCEKCGGKGYITAGMAAYACTCEAGKAVWEQAKALMRPHGRARDPGSVHLMTDELPKSAFAAISEAQWQAQVIAAARKLGWELVYHTRDSRGSEAGFPDLVLCKPPRLIFAELKREAKGGSGQLSAAQIRWLEALRGCPGVEVYVWRPSDCQEVWRRLEGVGL